MQFTCRDDAGSGNDLAWLEWLRPLFESRESLLAQRFQREAFLAEVVYRRQRDGGDVTEMNRALAEARNRKNLRESYYLVVARIQVASSEGVGVALAPDEIHHADYPIISTNHSADFPTHELCGCLYGPGVWPALAADSRSTQFADPEDCYVFAFSASGQSFFEMASSSTGAEGISSEAAAGASSSQQSRAAVPKTDRPVEVCRGVDPNANLYFDGDDPACQSTACLRASSDHGFIVGGSNLGAALSLSVDLDRAAYGRSTLFPDWKTGNRTSKSGATGASAPSMHRVIDVAAIRFVPAQASEEDKLDNEEEAGPTALQENQDTFMLNFISSSTRNQAIYRNYFG
ncbi:unnamed protein product [Amoebophrya sp. A25]|nr:unnamed protein product [Amoebophrya sp. A25]|eukprot:GSA25T00011453001.1